MGSSRLMNTINNMENRQQAIDGIIETILDNFDFTKVSAVMQFLDWKWYLSSATESQVPKVNDLKEMARELMLVSANKKVSCSSGGLAVTYNDGGEGNNAWVSMELNFSIETVMDDRDYTMETIQ